jgi:uncharacterized protein YciI
MSPEQAATSDESLPTEMTQIYLGLLKKGPAWTSQASEQVHRDQRAHLDLLAELGSSGRLLLAGPVPDGEQVRGFVICRADSLLAAKGYFVEDHHIRSGRLVLEMHPWLVPSAQVAPLFIRRNYG